MSTLSVEPSTRRAFSKVGDTVETYDEPCFRIIEITDDGKRLIDARGFDTEADAFAAMVRS